MTRLLNPNQYPSYMHDTIIKNNMLLDRMNISNYSTKSNYSAKSNNLVYNDNSPVSNIGNNGNTVSYESFSAFGSRAQSILD